MIDIKVWIPSITECWIEGTIIEKKETHSIINCKGELITINNDLISLCDPDIKKINNLTDLINLHEASILHSLYERYTDDVIYTFTGPILLAVNPFKATNLYNNELRDLYRSNDKTLPPHVYSIAQSAYTSMCEGSNQSILVSGESGAGKTQSTKIMMNYLANIAGSSNDCIQRVLQCNPILEAFGNAKTIRNDNSSRFGKYIKLLFKNTKLVGAQIDTYLLEKIRVINQNPNERNFHIFYLLEHLPQQEKELIGLDNLSSYTYIKNVMKRDDNVSDKDELNVFVNAMKVMGFTDAERIQVYQMIISVLLLGNTEYTSDFSITDTLQIDKMTFITSLKKKKIKAGYETVLTEQTQEQFINSRNALAKMLYNCLFDWIVKRINECIMTTDYTHYIGILDIFGFEVFDNNYLEQLCINYTNECLQQQFNKYIFKLEQAEYRKEQINWKDITFPDNQETLDLIECSIFNILNDTCMVPKGNDSTFANRVYTELKDHEYLSADHKQRVESQFCIKHYAGDVCYSSKDICDKNKDRINQDILDALGKTQSDFLKEILHEYTYEKTQTIKTFSSFKFNKQLSDLVKVISMTKPHYIRCLKPNDKNIADNFCRFRMNQQLHYSGVLETVKVSRAGYSVRMLIPEFCLDYQLLTSGYDSKDNLCKYILNYLKVDSSEYQIGLTKVFFKKDTFDDLKVKRSNKIEELIISLQKNVRRLVYQRAYKRKKKACVVIQSYTRRYIAIKFVETIRRQRASIIIQKFVRRYIAFINYRAKERAVSLLQCCIRRHWARQAVLKILVEKSVVTLESYARMNKYRRYFLSYRRKIVLLQCRYRCKLAVNCLKHLRIEARSVNKLQQNVTQMKQELEKMDKQNNNLCKQIAVLSNNNRDKDTQIQHYKDQIGKLAEQVNKMTIHTERDKDTKQILGKRLQDLLIENNNIAEELDCARQDAKRKFKFGDILKIFS